MIVIYHAPRPLLARMAAALHLAGDVAGQAPPAAFPGPAGSEGAAPATRAATEQARALLLPVSGLRLEGTDPDGVRVYSAATGAAPGVVARALAGFAGLLGVPPRAYRLVTVPEPLRPLTPLLALLARTWPEAALAAYRRLTWPAVRRAVAAARRRPSPAGGGLDGRSPEVPAPGRAAEGRVIHIYHCYGGAHTSVTAASLHLGQLPPRAGYHQILAQPHFDRLPHAAIGQPILMGHDAAGHPVYCIGLEAGRERLARALLDFAAALGVPPGMVRFHDALPAANGFMRVGGFLSRRAGLVAVGRPLVTLGTWRAVPHLWRLVAPTVAACRAAPARRAPDRVDGPAAVADNGTRCKGAVPWPVLSGPSSRPSAPGARPTPPGSGPETG